MIRVKVRLNTASEVLSISEEITLNEFIKQIASKFNTLPHELFVKAGFPPQYLDTSVLGDTPLG
jgi:hypothetical protein